MNPSKLSRISFWKRSPDSVERIEKIILTPEEDGTMKAELFLPEEKLSSLSEEESRALKKALFEDLRIQETEAPYLAYLYEDSTDDFNLKFFLVAEDSDFLYLAIKGIHPFKEPHYQEIMKLFSDLIEEKRK
jgi:hypothetical protein